MSNLSSVSVLGAEFTRYIAVQGESSFFFSEKKTDDAIAKSFQHFPEGKVSLGLSDDPSSLSDITELREAAIVLVEAPQAEENTVEKSIAEKRRERKGVRNSNHGPRQAAYFGL